MKRDVFISYRSTHVSVAKELRSRLLEKYRIRCFIDTADLRPERDWTRELDESLTKASMVIFIGSYDAFESREVWSEVSRARELGKPVVRWLLWPKNRIGEIIEGTEFGAKILDDSDKANYASAQENPLSPTESDYELFVDAFHQEFADHINLTKQVALIRKGGGRSNDAATVLIAQYYHALEFVLPDFVSLATEAANKTEPITHGEWQTLMRMLRVTHSVAERMSETAAEGGGDSLSAQRARLTSDETMKIVEILDMILIAYSRTDFVDSELDLAKAARAIDPNYSIPHFSQSLMEWGNRYQEGNDNANYVIHVIFQMLLAVNGDAYSDLFLERIEASGYTEKDLEAIALWGSLEAVPALERLLADAGDSSWATRLKNTINKLGERHCSSSSVAPTKRTYFLKTRPEDAVEASLGGLQHFTYSDVMRALRLFEIGELTPTPERWFKARIPKKLDDILAKPVNNQVRYGMKYTDLQGRELFLAPKDVFWMTELLLRGKCDQTFVLYGGDINTPLSKIGFEVVTLHADNQIEPQSTNTTSP